MLNGEQTKRMSARKLLESLYKKSPKKKKKKKKERERERKENHLVPGSPLLYLRHGSIPLLEDCSITPLFPEPYFVEWGPETSEVPLPANPRAGSHPA